MNARHLPAALLLLAAILLYLGPADWLLDLRLSLYGTAVHAAGERPDYATQTALAQRCADLEARLMQKDAQLHRLQRQLRSFTDAQTHVPHLRFAPARVLARGQGPLGDTLIIDRGRLDHIDRHAAALHGHALAGTVFRLAERTALVRLLSSPASLVAAHTGESRETCAVVGRGRGRLRVIFHHVTSTARAGEAVLTSGLLGRHPEGLVIGTLAESPQEGAEPNTLEADLVPQAPLSAVEDLLLVQRLDGVAPPVSPAETR